MTGVQTCALPIYHSPFWSNVLEDQDGFFQFLMDIGVRMGNKRPKRDGADDDGADANAPLEIADDTL